MGRAKKGRSYDVVRLSDWHVPFHDEDAIEVAFEFCKHLQPKIIVVDELHDFYAISRYDKDPKRKTGEHLQSELDTVNGYLAQLRSICPKARIVMLASNHLDRLKKYLWKKAPELNGLDALRLENLIRLKENKIEYHKDFVFRNFLFKHGNIVRKHSSYTAKGEFLDEGMSGMTGHTHRLGQYYVTQRGGKYTWVECGCLCITETAEYINGVPNWQHGVGLVSFKGNSDHFDARPIPIIDYEILFGDVSIT